MVPTPRRLLLGREPRRLLWPVLALLLFLATFTAYAVGVFHISGGVVLIPGEAALVGLLAAAAVGAVRGGAAFAWLVTYGALLGYHADHAFMGLSHRSRLEQAAYFVELDGLVVLAVEAVVVGTLAFAVGTVARWGYDTLRSRLRASVE